MVPRHLRLSSQKKTMTEFAPVSPSQVVAPSTTDLIENSNVTSSSSSAPVPSNEPTKLQQELEYLRQAVPFSVWGKRYNREKWVEGVVHDLCITHDKICLHRIEWPRGTPVEKWHERQTQLDVVTARGGSAFKVLEYIPRCHATNPIRVPLSTYWTDKVRLGQVTLAPEYLPVPLGDPDPLAAASDEVTSSSSSSSSSSTSATGGSAPAPPRKRKRAPAAASSASSSKESKEAKTNNIASEGKAESSAVSNGDSSSPLLFVYSDPSTPEGHHPMVVRQPNLNMSLSDLRVWLGQQHTPLPSDLRFHIRISGTCFSHLLPSQESSFTLNEILVAPGDEEKSVRLLCPAIYLSRASLLNPWKECC